MAITAKRILEIAVAELGYREKESNSQLDNSAANAGDGNWTKYARDLHAAGYYNGNKNGYAWCDVFVDWLFYMLCGKDAAKAQKVICQSGPYGAGCRYSAKYYRDAGRFYSDPEVGDQIFFGTKGSENHTGIVEAITATHVKTIEGNTSNQVARRSYALSNSKIVGYGRPKYEADTESVAPPTTPTPPASTTKTVEEIAREVLGGKWGNGADRKNRLTAAGYNYRAVQDKVNELCASPSPAPSTTTKKSVEEVAREVIRGKWGNGAERRQKLTAAGYDYRTVQNKVNELLR